MVSTGAFALATFALIYGVFEVVFFFSGRPTHRRDIFKAVLISIPFLVYVCFYFSVAWQKGNCTTEGDLSVVFTVAFAFSGVAIIALFTNYAFTAAHALLYSSINVAVLVYKSNEELCDLKPELLAFSMASGACAFVLFVMLSLQR